MRYFIKNTVDLKGDWFVGAVQREDTVRYNLDGTKCILKYRGDIPDGLKGELTQSEILNFIEKPENGWVEE